MAWKVMKKWMSQTIQLIIKAFVTTAKDESVVFDLKNYGTESEESNISRGVKTLLHVKT